jgi:chromosome segregation ATPase
MRLKTITEYEKRICDLQKELEVVCADIAEVDRQAAALLEQQNNLSVEQLKNGARAVVREERNQIVDRIDDLELIRESIKTEIEQLETLRDLVQLMPQVKEYQQVSEKYLTTFAGLRNKVQAMSALAEEVKTLTGEFSEMRHPLTHLLPIFQKVTEAGFNLSSFLQGQLSTDRVGDADGELTKFSMVLNPPELKTLEKALSNLQDQLFFNPKVYNAPFYVEQEKPMQSGRLGGIQTLVDKTQYRRFDGPDPVMRGDNHEQVAA